LKVMKNFKIPFHNVIRKKESIVLYSKYENGDDLVLKKGDGFQFMRGDPPYLISMTCCVTWDFESRGWKFHESCADKGILKVE